jgi:hypothetical protein
VFNQTGETLEGLDNFMMILKGGAKCNEDPSMLYDNPMLKAASALADNHWKQSWNSMESGMEVGRWNRQMCIGVPPQ